MDKAEVHSGFLEAFEIIQDELITVVSNLIKEYPHAPIFITGYSLGGCLAQLAALYLVEKLKIPQDKLTLYTYGQSRLGDTTFSDYTF